MARPIRIQYPGALYHIITRGNERSNIFNAPEDYQNFLLVFFNTIKRYNWICYAYCLMPNHYHLLVKTNEANLSPGMRQLNGVYAQNFNIRNKRMGHLFHGRFKSILAEEENYKNELKRINDLKGGIILGSNGFVKKVKDYFKKQEKEIEIPVKERLVSRPSLEVLFKNKTISKDERNEAIYNARIYYGYLLSGVANYLNIHYTTISRIFKKEKTNY